jgi:hypothetical protein
VVGDGLNIDELPRQINCIDGHAGTG